MAKAFVDANSKGSALDLGAGTGFFGGGAALAVHGVKPVHATDTSPEMLSVARSKEIYAKLFEGKLMERLPVGDETCAGAVSIIR